MDIIVADCAGACYGVNRALKLVKKASEKADRVYTLGPLIHNPRVVSDLQAEGIGVAETLDDVFEGDTIVIRSHGVAPEVIAEANKRGLIVEDATCPHVSKAHKAAAELSAKGYFVVVVGETGHPEVEGICACAPGNVLVVSSGKDLPEVLPEKIGVVVQTTQSLEALHEVVSALKLRTSDLVVKNTICFATQQRQESAANLAAQVDVMIVIGGRNSGNTRRLFEICKKSCNKTYHIETLDELDPAWFEHCEKVGVTAGASTPESQIDAVLHVLTSME